MYEFSILASVLLYKYPIGMLLVFSIILLRQYTGVVRLISIVSIIFVFNLINITKLVEGDLESYLNLYAVFAQLDIESIIFSNEHLINYSGSFRNTEVLGYLVYWFAANFISDGKATFEFITVALVYIPGLAAIRIISQHLGLDKDKSFIIYLAFLFVCVNPALVTHLSRQYVAGSFFLLAVALVIANRSLYSLISMFIAISFHNSMAVVMGLSYVSYYLYTRHKIGVDIAVIISIRFWVLVAISIGFLIYYLVINPNAILQDDGRISITMLVIDSALLIFLGRFGKEHFPRFFVSVVSAVLLGLILLSMLSAYIGIYLFSLRFYFYIELFRCFGVLALYCLILDNFPRLKSILSYLFAVIFVAYFFMKLQFSPFSYADKGFSLLLIDMQSLANSIVVN